MENKTASCRYLCQIIGTLLVCERLRLTIFFVVCLLFVCCAIMFIFFMWLELFWAWPSYTRIPTFMQIPIPIHTHMRHLYYVRVGCCNGAMLTPGFFPFFSINWVENSYRPFVPSFVSSYRSRCLGKSVSPSPVLCATDSLIGCPVLYAFSC